MNACSTTFPALGTSASLVVTDPRSYELALDVLRAELADIDLAASRFRDDSELSHLNRSADQFVKVSDLLFEAIEAALRAARITGGLVDPTVGTALKLIGYDRDFALIAPDGPPLHLTAHAVPGWQAVTTDTTTSTVRIPKGVELDLGATAKALSADRAATRAASVTGSGVLISLGGDIAVAGDPPDGGWSVRIRNDHADPPDSGGHAVAISAGGLATSSTSVRRWQRGDRAIHHLIDPSTGQPAAEHWMTVSVAAGSCLDANIASCASILLGAEAPAWLADRDLPARLVDPAGRVSLVGGWPAEEGS